MRVDVKSLIDNAPLGPCQMGIFILCGVIALVDGFDTQSIAFAAPAIAAAWNVSPAQFGLAFGTGLFGALFGGMLLGPLGDRVGRRKILIFAVVLFGATSWGTAHSQSIGVLIFWRFVTGLGLGGAIPCLIALTSEYAPTGCERRSLPPCSAAFRSEPSWAAF